MTKSLGILTAVLALAAPAGASARSPSGGSRATTATMPAAPPRHIGPARPARGGGPGRQIDRARVLHAASPHIITVETQLDAARDQSRGLARIMVLEPSPISAEYREHVRALSSGIASSLGIVRRHLDVLRASVRTLGMTDRVADDLAQTEQALAQARSDLEQLGRASAAPGGDSEHVREVSEDITRALQTARSAMDRVERRLR